MLTRTVYVRHVDMPGGLPGDGSYAQSDPFQTEPHEEILSVETVVAPSGLATVRVWIKGVIDS